MFLNQFTAAIQADHAVERADGYVEMVHGETYAVRLTNGQPVRANARLVIDGQECGTFRLAPHQTILLERPAQDRGQFTFYRTGSREAAQVGIVTGDPLNGLVQIVFTPELEQSFGVWQLEQELYYQEKSPASLDSASRPRSMNPQSSSVAYGDYAGGGTGLSGASAQEFGTAGAMELDFSQMTTISLRLVVRKEMPRPLTTPRPLRANRPPRPVE